MADIQQAQEVFMGLLQKLVAEGWWDRASRPESDIDITAFTDKNVEELVRKRHTVVVDPKKMAMYDVRIASSRSLDALTSDDFEIVKISLNCTSL